MGLAYYPSFEKKIKGYEPATEVSGKGIAKSIEKLDTICKKLKVPSLSSFQSQSMEESYDADDLPPGFKPTPIVFTDPAVGISTIDALLKYFESPRSPAGPVDDLEDLKKALKVAAKHKTRFRLIIDF
jgi:hypothetical protein